MVNQTMFQETTKPFLRPRQTEELKEEVGRLRQMLSAPPHIANRIEDRGQLNKNLCAAEHDLQTQAPTAYGEDELDAATKRSAELQDKMLGGMPTQAEMRRNPPGAVDKHRRWERRNKTFLSEWKNIQLRLHQNGYGDLPDATDLANFERFRPVGGSGEMSMENAQIPQTRTTQLPPPGAGPVTVMSNEQAEMLESMNPELHDKMALLSNEQRAEVLGLVDSYMQGTQPVKPTKELAEKKPRRKKPKGSYNDSMIAQLRAEAKVLGISSFQKGREQLRAEIAERRAV